MTLGEKLKTLRTQRRWSQRDLAERAKVRQALISYLESGKQADTTGATLRKLAFALGCTVDYLTGYNGSQDPHRAALPPVTDPAPRFLDEPFILQRIALEHIADLLRPLAADRLSPLPVRLRNQLARMHNRVRALSRELYQHPDQLARERVAEEPPPPRGPAPDP